LNERAGKEKRKIVVKMLMDVASVKNALGPRFHRDPATWESIGIPAPEKLNNLNIEIVNYHCAPLGTFHVKLIVVDRTIALVNSNNVNVRSNVEMMCRFEGDVVNSIYDTFLISWCTAIQDPPGLPCLSKPTVAERDFSFGQKDVSLHPGAETSLVHELVQDEQAYLKEDHPNKMAAVNKRLNINKEAEATSEDDVSDFSPYIFHSPHKPVPMAVVNRQPYGMPGHSDLHTPQNAAWLAGLRFAEKEVLIQSPVFNAKPAVDAVLEACKRGIIVTLYVDIGFNDLAETVPFQGGTNEQVMRRMFDELIAYGKEDNLRYHWYTAKDQNVPIHFETGQRNCHVKFFQVDGKVGIMGSGNMDTQSWFHSAEVNVMIDSEDLVKEWLNGLNANQNTEKYGRINPQGELMSGKPVPKKQGHGGLSRSKGGFL